MNVQVDPAAALIAVAALVLAALAAWRSGKLQRELLRIEKQRREDEEQRKQRAEMTGRFAEVREQRSGTHRSGVVVMTRHFLVLENRGGAPAQNVSIELTRHDGASLERTILGIEDGEFPIRTIDPGGDYAVTVTFAMGCPLRYQLRITWVDSTGPREKTLPLRPFGPS